MKQETRDYLDDEYEHLVNADGFNVYYRPDEDDVGLRQLYIVIPQRGVSVSVTTHDYSQGVGVMAAQGIHDVFGQSEHIVDMSINIPDGEKL